MTATFTPNLRACRTHHAYTNDNELDPDSASADPILLFHDHDPSLAGGDQG